MNKKIIVYFIVLSFLMTACASSQPMKFSASKQGLTQLDYYNAREDCQKIAGSGGSWAVGPAVFVAAVMAVNGISKAQARQTFVECMENRGFKCELNCPDTPQKSDTSQDTNDMQAIRGY